MSKPKISAELEQLLRQARFLTDDQKNLYLELCKHLSRSRLSELCKIFKKGSFEFAKIDSDEKQTIAKINKKYLGGARKLVLDSEKEFIRKEEAFSREESEKLLKKLTDL